MPWIVGQTIQKRYSIQKPLHPVSQQSPHPNFPLTLRSPVQANSGMTLRTDIFLAFRRSLSLSREPQGASVARYAAASHLAVGVAEIVAKNWEKSC